MKRVLLLISSMLTYNTLAVDIKVKKSENQIENEGSFKDKTIFSEMIKNGDIETAKIDRDHDCISGGDKGGGGSGGRK